MGNPAYMQDIGNHIKAAFCGASVATAAGTGDATAVTGATIDRLGFDSCKAVISYRAVLAATETLSIAAEYQESDDGSTWDTAVALQASTVEATGESGGSTETGIQTFDLSLRAKKRYVRFNFTPDLSASATDTAQTHCNVILGGAVETPNAD